MVGVLSVQQTQHFPAGRLAGSVDMLRFVRREEITHRSRIGDIDHRPLMPRRQKTGGEIAEIVVGQPLRVRQHDELRKVLIDPAKRITNPSPHARKARQREPCCLHVAAQTVHVRRRVHRHEERQVVHHGCHVRQHLADPAAALAMPPKRERTLQHLESWRVGHRLDQAAIARVKLLPVQGSQLRLVVESVHLADSAVHEQLNHPLGLGNVIQGRAKR